MKTPHNWQSLKRHPLSAEYQDLHGQAWADFVADMHRVGYLADRPIVLHERKVLDGWQRLRGAIEALVEPTFARLPEGVDPEDYLSAINDHRRHMGQEQARTKAEARRERVMRARAEGKSNRVIAEEEGVDEKTIRKDIAASGADHGSAPENENGTVVGKDGKTYPASRAQTATDEDDSEPKVETDEAGTPIPDHVLPAFASAKELAALCRDIDRLRQKAEYYAGEPGGRCIRLEAVKQQLNDAKGNIWANRPTHVCPYCEAKAAECQACKADGWVPRHVYQQAPGVREAKAS